MTKEQEKETDKRVKTSRENSCRKFYIITNYTIKTYEFYLIADILPDNAENVPRYLRKNKKPKPTLIKKPVSKPIPAFKLLS